MKNSLWKCKLAFAHQERVTRAKLQQSAAGVRPAVMWGAAAVFDWLWFVVLCLPIIISCAAFAVLGLSTAKELGKYSYLLHIY